MNTIAIASEEVDNQVKSGIKICLKTFLKDKTVQEKELPNSFTASQRAYVHQEAKKLSLLSKSRGRGFHRFVTIYKKDSLNFLKNDTKLNVTANTRKMAMLYSTQYQLTRPERQDLTPNFDRDRPRQESCRTMSRLTPGNDIFFLKSLFGENKLSYEMIGMYFFVLFRNSSGASSAPSRF